MKSFWKSAVALFAAIVMAMPLSAADAAVDGMSGFVVKEPAGETTREPVPVTYPTNLKNRLVPVSHMRLEVEDKVVSMELGSLIDDDASTAVVLDTTSEVISLYCNAEKKINVSRILVVDDGAEYVMTLSASPDNICWYDLGISVVQSKDGYRVYDVSTVREYKYFQLDFITDEDSLEISTIAVMDKPVVNLYAKSKLLNTKSKAESAPAQPVVKTEDAAATTTTDAAVQTEEQPVATVTTTETTVTQTTEKTADGTTTTTTTTTVTTTTVTETSTVEK